MADVDFLGTLAPPSGGSLPITRGEYIMGAVKVVANAAARDAIATTQLRTKDLCLLADTGVWYQWSGASWSAYTGFAGGGGAGGDAFKFTFSTTTTDADPGAGTLRFDNATPASITKVYVDDTDASGTDITAWLASLDDAPGTTKGRITIQSVSDPTKKLVFTLSAWTTATGYKKLSVAWVFGTALPPTTANDLVLSFDANPTGGDLRQDGSLPLAGPWSLGSQALSAAGSIGYTKTNDVDTGTAKTIDFSLTALHKVRATGNCTFTLTPPAAADTPVQIEITEDGTGGHTHTWPGTVLWDVGYAPKFGGGPDSKVVIGGYWDGTNYIFINPDRGVRIVTETTTARTCVATDANAKIKCTNAAGCSITIPPRSSVPYEQGTVILASQFGAAQVTFVAGAGVVIRTPDTLKSLKQYATIGVELIDPSTNEWLAFGLLELA